MRSQGDITVLETTLLYGTLKTMSEKEDEEEVTLVSLFEVGSWTSQADTVLLVEFLSMITYSQGPHSPIYGVA